MSDKNEVTEPISYQEETDEILDKLPEWMRKLNKLLLSEGKVVEDKKE